MKWFVIGFASFVLFFFSSFLPSNNSFAQSYCNQGDVCMDVYDELACQNSFGGIWMADNCIRPDPLGFGDCCVPNGCSGTQYCDEVSFEDTCIIDLGGIWPASGCREVDGTEGTCCIGCVGENVDCTSGISCCGFPEYTCQFISETERICREADSPYDCGAEGEPCCDGSVCDNLFECRNNVCMSPVNLACTVDQGCSLGRPFGW